MISSRAPASPRFLWHGVSHYRQRDVVGSSVQMSRPTYWRRRSNAVSDFDVYAHAVESPLWLCGIRPQYIPARAGYRSSQVIILVKCRAQVDADRSAGFVHCAFDGGSQSLDHFIVAVETFSVYKFGSSGDQAAGCVTRRGSAASGFSLGHDSASGVLTSADNSPLNRRARHIHRDLFAVFGNLYPLNVSRGARSAQTDCQMPEHPIPGLLPCGISEKSQA